VQLISLADVIAELGTLPGIGSPGSVRVLALQQIGDGLAIGWLLPHPQVMLALEEFPGEVGIPSRKITAGELPQSVLEILSCFLVEGIHVEPVAILERRVDLVRQLVSGTIGDQRRSEPLRDDSVPPRFLERKRLFQAEVPVIPTERQRRRPL
jgi:hypothetical protein